MMQQGSSQSPVPAPEHPRAGGGGGCSGGGGRSPWLARREPPCRAAVVERADCPPDVLTSRLSSSAEREWTCLFDFLREPFWTPLPQLIRERKSRRDQSWMNHVRRKSIREHSKRGAAHAARR